MSKWKFVTNHGLVLASISKKQDKTAREISDEVSITERATHKIITDLEKDGYIIKTKVGNRNKYRVCSEVPIKASDAK
ncbi:helix-turn-helix transcriptional regulator, partial [Chloroflexota bacterium]